MVYVIQVMLTILYPATYYADSLLASSQHNLYDIHVYLLLCVRCWTPDDGQRDCPKHVEFHSKSTFENLVHLIGFVIGNIRMNVCHVLCAIYMVR